MQNACLATTYSTPGRSLADTVLKKLECMRWVLCSTETVQPVLLSLGLVVTVQGPRAQKGDKRGGPDLVGAEP